MAYLGHFLLQSQHNLQGLGTCQGYLDNQCGQGTPEFYKSLILHGICDYSSVEWELCIAAHTLIRFFCMPMLGLLPLP